MVGVCMGFVVVSIFLSMDCICVLAGRSVKCKRITHMLTHRKIKGSRYRKRIRKVLGPVWPNPVVPQVDAGD